MVLVEMNSDASNEASALVARLASSFDVRTASSEPRVVSIYVLDAAIEDLDEARVIVGEALDRIDAAWREHLSFRGD